jgi:chromosome partitioning protein
MLTIAVLNQKGGVGKTTIATNLAAAAFLGRHRTLLLDLDQQGSSLDWFRARQPSSKIRGLVTVKFDKPITVPQYREVTKGFDLVVLDGPPRLGAVTRSAAAIADLVVIPVTPGPYDLWALDETLPLLSEADAIAEQLGRRPAPRLFLINGAIINTKLARHIPEPLAEQSTNAETSRVVVHRRVAFPEAASIGETVLNTQPTGPAAAEIRQLFATLTRRVGRHL